MWNNGTFAQYPLRKRSLRNGHFAKYTLRSWTLRGRKLRPTNTSLMDTSRADTSRTKNVKIFFKNTPENYMQALQNLNSSPLQSVPNTLPRPLFPPPQPLRPMFQPPHFGFYNPIPLAPLSAPRMMPTQVPLRPLTQTSSSNFFFAPPPPRRQ